MNGFSWSTLTNDPKRPSPHNINAYIKYLEWLTSLQTNPPTNLGIPPTKHQQSINEAKAMDYAE